MKNYRALFWSTLFLFTSSSQAQSVCRELFERVPVKVTQNELSTTYHLLAEQVNAVHNDIAFFDSFVNAEPGGWESYNSVSKMLALLESTSASKLSSFEKLSLKKEFAARNESIDSTINVMLENDPAYRKRLMQNLDKNYHYFAMLEKINKMSGAKIFPKSRLALVPTARETIVQAEKLIADLNVDFAKDFVEHSGHKSFDDYKKLLENFDETSKLTLDILENNLIVAMHRPESARFWVPLTGFQNQRVTGSSKGAMDPTMRSNAESNLLKMTQEEFDKNSVRFMPKYAEAILGPDNKNIYNGYSADHYGKDLWILKKEVVKKRATWTPNDSLAPGLNGPAPTRLDGFLPWTFRSLAAPNYHESIKERKQFIPTSSNSKLMFNSKNWRYGSMYMEVQIFGELSIHDVEALHFRGNPPDQQMMEYLKSHDIKVYDDRKGQRVPNPYGMYYE